ncbi:hypothetical protein SKAU_G00408490 [Synaphobranchus kaupii]|uniref:SEA domain-containing protein n=1 Tax=Synaphobranchus kaupii TaxID=118154 RepID=A0A9Q1EAI5_SYNKA|nr:hypothetical protein SKAU_G00408490 [Synaphobranchus kaupii]
MFGDKRQVLRANCSTNPRLDITEQLAVFLKAEAVPLTPRQHLQASAALPPPPIPIAYYFFIRITNRLYNDSLQDYSSVDYKRLRSEVTQLVNRWSRRRPRWSPPLLGAGAAATAGGGGVPGWGIAILVLVCIILLLLIIILILLVIRWFCSQPDTGIMNVSEETNLYTNSTPSGLPTYPPVKEPKQPYNKLDDDSTDKPKKIKTGMYVVNH